METKTICIVGASGVDTSSILESFRNKPGFTILKIDSFEQYNQSVVDKLRTIDICNIDGIEPMLDRDSEDNFKRKNRLSQMGKSPYGPQKLHRKK